MEMYIEAGNRVAIDAQAAGLDPGQAHTAWSACIRHVAANPATYAPAANESREQRRRRLAEARKRRAELKRVAGFALGITLLSVLINWALGRLLSWIVDRVIADMENTPPEQWADMFPTQQAYGFLYVPMPFVPWYIRLAWWLVDCVQTCHK